jgi:hypothetical protein
MKPVFSEGGMHRIADRFSQLGFSAFPEQEFKTNAAYFASACRSKDKHSIRN